MTALCASSRRRSFHYNSDYKYVSRDRLIRTFRKAQHESGRSKCANWMKAVSVSSNINNILGVADVRLYNFS